MRRPAHAVPVTMGSTRSVSAEVDGFRIIDAWFPPGSYLAPHVHDRACFAVMLEGSFRLRFGARGLSCAPSTVFTEPAGERHANEIEAEGARVVVIQPDPARSDLLRPCRDVLEAIGSATDPAVTGAAWRLARELRRPDELAPLAMEGLALEALATAARLRSPRVRPGGRMERVREILHDRFLEPLTTAEIAREVGLHPAYLARAFRRRHRMTVAAYLRRLRLEWAARRVGAGGEPLAQIASEAGFADQSHFTREFRRLTGLTPGRYRRRGR